MSGRVFFWFVQFLQVFAVPMTSGVQFRASRVALRVMPPVLAALCVLGTASGCTSTADDAELSTQVTGATKSWDQLDCDCQSRMSLASTFDHWLPHVRRASTWYTEGQLSEASKRDYFLRDVLDPRPSYRVRLYEPSEPGRGIRAMVLPAGLRFFLGEHRVDDYEMHDPVLIEFSRARRADLDRLLQGLPVLVDAEETSDALNDALRFIRVLRNSPRLGPDPLLMGLAHKPFDFYVFEFEDATHRHHFAYSMAPLSSFERCGLPSLGFAVRPRTRADDIAAYRVSLVAAARLPEGGLTAWLYKSGEFAYVGLEPKRGENPSAVQYAVTRRDAYAYHHPEEGIYNASGDGVVQVYTLVGARSGAGPGIQWLPVTLRLGSASLVKPEGLYLYKQIVDHVTIPDSMGEFEIRFTDKSLLELARREYPGLFQFLRGDVRSTPLHEEEVSVFTRARLVRERLLRENLLAGAPFRELPPQVERDLTALARFVLEPAHLDALVSLHAERGVVAPAGALIEALVPGLQSQQPP
jgi:hypothetical protein